MNDSVSFRAQANSVKRLRLVVVGNGPASGRLLDALIERGAFGNFDIVVFGDETDGCYNRVLLSRVLAGASPESILLKGKEWYAEREVRFLAGVRAIRVDMDRRVVVGQNGHVIPFDMLVLATGSRAVVPPLPGLYEDDALKRGIFVFRTLRDCRAIREAASEGEPAIVLGGGLLGLEAAKGLSDLGMTVTVLDRAPGPMARQLDQIGQEVLASRLEAISIRCRGDVAVQEVLGDSRVTGVKLTNGQVFDGSVLILACGIQPNVELARGAGIPVGRAIQVNEWMSVEGVPGVYGIGECVEFQGQLFGTVAPIWEQVEVLADVLSGMKRASGFRISRDYTKLKVAGIEVASLGTVEADVSQDEVVEVVERKRARYHKLIVRNNRLIGAQFVGDSSAVARLLRYSEKNVPLPDCRLDLLASEDSLSESGKDESEVCNCRHVSETAILEATEAGASTLAVIGEKTGAGTGCGSCHGAIARLLLASQRSQTLSVRSGAKPNAQIATASP